MEFDLTETQKLFKRSARELFAQECPPSLVREMIEKGKPYSSHLWEKLVEQGWTGLIFSEEVGGLGLGMVDLAVAFEEMGWSLASNGFLSTVPLAGSLIEKAGSADHQEKYLKAICDGRARATVAILEETANWDLDFVRLPATETAGGISITGRKLFVSDAEAADIIITAVRTGNGLALAVVDKNSPGLTLKLMPSLDATRPLYELDFNEVNAPSSNLLARGASARDAIEYAIDVATLALSAEMVGGMQKVMESAVEYAKTRKQFGKPIGQFQAVQHHCANMLLMTESSRSAVYYAAWVMGAEPDQAPLAVSMAKAYASDAYREVGNLGVQVEGGIGFTWDEDLHFYYKRAKASELMFGDATFHRERIARIVVDKAAEPVRAASAD
jgi:alkylation response protein AidB-like acyl-CoA dehydrogenase